MRAIGAAVIVVGLIGWWIAVAVFGVFDTSKRLSKKETRPEAVVEIKQSAKAAGTIAGGMAKHYLILFGAIFLLLVIANALGLD